MWVICAGLPRSASTWQYMIASDIVERYLGGKRCGPADFHLLKEAHDMASDGRPRTFKTHLSNERFETLINSGITLNLYSFRDLRDVAVSLTHQWKMSLDQLFASNTFKWLIDTDRFWKNQPRTLVQRYETIVADRIEAVKEIGRHLEVILSDRQAADLSEEFSIEKNSERCEAFADSLSKSGADLDSQSASALKDPTTELHWNHIRSGRVGQWTEMSEQHQRRLHEVCGEWLTHNGYEIAHT